MAEKYRIVVEAEGGNVQISIQPSQPETLTLNYSP